MQPHDEPITETPATSPATKEPFCLRSFLFNSFHLKLWCNQFFLHLLGMLPLWSLILRVHQWTYEKVERRKKIISPWGKTLVSDDTWKNDRNAHTHIQTHKFEDEVIPLNGKIFPSKRPYHYMPLNFIFCKYFFSDIINIWQDRPCRFHWISFMWWCGVVCMACAYAKNAVSLQIAHFISYIWIKARFGIEWIE